MQLAGRRKDLRRLRIHLAASISAAKPSRRAQLLTCPELRLWFCVDSIGHRGEDGVHSEIAPWDARRVIQMRRRYSCAGRSCVCHLRRQPRMLQRRSMQAAPQVNLPLPLRFNSRNAHPTNSGSVFNINISKFSGRRFMTSGSIRASLVI